MSQCSLDSPVLSHLKMHVDLCQARDEACYNLVSFKDGIHEISNIILCIVGNPHY